MVLLNNDPLHILGVSLAYGRCIRDSDVVVTSAAPAGAAPSPRQLAPSDSVTHCQSVMMNLTWVTINIYSRI